MRPDTERALNPIRQAQAGDLEAFEMLVQQHAPKLYRLATGIVGVSDAHHITQETFTAVIGPAFRGLSADHRSVLALHYGLGLSISETADAMDVRVGTAKSRLNAALRIMRIALSPLHSGTSVADEQAVSQ